MPYNRTTSLETLFSVTFESMAEVDTRLNLEISAFVSFDSASEMETVLLREISIAAEMETATEILAQLIRERYLAATIESHTEINVGVTYSHVDEITFIGGFKPGDRLVIDTKRKTVTLNGQNALHMVDGDFFELIFGTNTLTYTDTATSRNILTRVTHRDKYLY